MQYTRPVFLAKAKLLSQVLCFKHFTYVYCSQKVGDIRILKIITFTKRMS